MNKQELIDNVIEHQKGIWPKEKGNEFYQGYYIGLATGKMHMRGTKYNSAVYPLCDENEFTARARELGWINGYKYGIEYPTNGKKPDLPKDLKVEVKFNHADTIWYKDIVENWQDWRWRVGGIVGFRIVDDRYKPATEQPAEPKQDHGELPPVGWKGEYKPFWHACEVVAHHKGFAVVWDAHDLEYFRTNKPEIFRPIKSERERFVEAALEIADRSTNYTATFKQMYDAGFRAPE